VISCGVCSHAGCSFVISNCGGCSFVASIPCQPLSNCGLTNCGGTINCGGSVIDPGGPLEQADNLAALKAQLQQALAQVEAQQKAVEESLQPKTVEEVDTLTQKLTEALAELKSRKETIQKQEAAKKPHDKKS